MKPRDVTALEHRVARRLREVDERLLRRDGGRERRAPRAEADYVRLARAVMGMVRRRSGASTDAYVRQLFSSARYARVSAPAADVTGSN